jgi:hypothetical protein
MIKAAASSLALTFTSHPPLASRSLPHFRYLTIRDPPQKAPAYGRLSQGECRAEQFAKQAQLVTDQAFYLPAPVEFTVDEPAWRNSIHTRLRNACALTTNSGML